MSRIREIPELEELTFDEKPHVYRLDGIAIPSVSQVMEPLNRAKYARINERTLMNAADRGTAVHNSIENLLKFGFEDYPAEHKAYIDAFKDWRQTYSPEVIGSEVRMYHKLLRYAGTADLICYIGDELCLYDFKTTYTVSQMTCGVQLEAYAQALESIGVKVARKRILHLQKTGAWKEYDFPAGDAARWRVFGACKTLYDYVHAE